MQLSPRQTARRPGATNSPACAHKLAQDQADLDVMQRELGVLNVQYYSDPVKGHAAGA